MDILTAPAAGCANSLRLRQRRRKVRFLDGEWGDVQCSSLLVYLTGST